MIFTTDDLCLSNLKYFKFWDEIKAKFPRLEIIAFTIANFKNEENIIESIEFKNWFDSHKDWVEIGVHGYNHTFPPEQFREEEEVVRLVKKSLEILAPFLPDRFLYRPPGHQRMVYTEKILKSLGFAGIAYQNRIRYFDTGEIIEGVINSHCCDEFVNPITEWERWWPYAISNSASQGTERIGSGVSRQFGQIY